MKTTMRRHGGVSVACGLWLSLLAGGAVAQNIDQPAPPAFTASRTTASGVVIRQQIPLGPDGQPIINPAGGISNIFTRALLGGIQVLLNFPLAADVIAGVLREKGKIIPKAQSTASLTTRDRPVPIVLSSKNLGFFAELVMQYKIETPPAHGKLSGTPPNLVYTPDPGFTGYDRLKFSATAPLQLLFRSEAQVDIKVNGSFNEFESGPVRPLALSSDANRLYAVNTPDNRLEVYDVSQSTPRLLNSVPVGMEPVAVALRNDGEAWVVNTLSDSVSVVDLNSQAPYVKRTLLVGDEPQDVVFAGPARQRAFITSAHRGQNSPSDPALTTPGIGRADVWVFDALGIDNAMGTPAPLSILTLFGTPARALAVSPDGATVYAAIFKSGNQTTNVGANDRALGANSTKCNKPGPTTELADQPDVGNLLNIGPCSGIDLIPDPLALRHRHAPNTGVIVQYDGKDWLDNYGTVWNDFVPFSLPDHDVFAIDANAAQPTVLRSYDHVGTSLFNIAVNPSSGALYVSNLEARNRNRFEGDIRVDGKLTVNGRFIYNRITVIDPRLGSVAPRNLDKHLNDAVTLGSADDSARSLALPLQMQIDNTGSTLYVAAYGSSEVGVFDVRQLEQDSFAPSAASHIKVSGGGPSGLVLDQARHRMFVATRFNNGISVVDTDARKEIASASMYNPEPDYVVKGRPFLYDARFSSSKGDSSCGSCHLFGDMDGLAWDLGNPQDKWRENPRDYNLEFSALVATPAFHPLKGPMTTQSLRGLEFQGPQHWRGDRDGADRSHGESIEHAAFKQFGPAFVSLLGRASVPEEADLDAFADYVMQLRYPPNPIRNLDNKLTASQAAGQDVFFNQLTTGLPALVNPLGGGPIGDTQAMFHCVDCHMMDPVSQRFGTSTLMSNEGLRVSTQDLKIPHLRNLYQKVGKFGMITGIKATANMGEQVAGFSFIEDGSVDTLQHFFEGSGIFAVKDADMPHLLDFLFSTDTGFAPIVGQQVTLSASNAAGGARLDLLISQALAHIGASAAAKTTQCELIAKAHVDGGNFEGVLQDDGSFRTDRANLPLISDASLRSLAQLPHNAITYTCAPPGAGQRMGLDRDEDGVVDALDPFNDGRAATSIAVLDPTATEHDKAPDPLTNLFIVHLIEAALGIYPNFTLF